VDAIIVAFDEVKFQLQPVYKRIWFPKGEKPKGAFFWSSKKLLTFGALTSNHRFFYEFYDSQNSLTFRHFLRYVIRRLSRKKKYVFILDNAGFHKTQTVRNLLNEFSSFISVEYLPPYSPELNPIETNWKVTKNAVTKSQYFPSIDEMQEALENFWGKHFFMQNFITYLCR
jgi:putative transposase